MRTLKEKVKELRDDYIKRTKQIDDIVVNVGKLIATTDKAVTDIQVMVDEANDAIDEVVIFATKLASDYKAMREELDELKRNNWFKLLLGWLFKR
jgi:hypothetical protein